MPCPSKCPSDALVRLFLLLDSAVHCALGAFLFFSPGICAEFILKRPSSDGVHWHLLRCVGGQLLASAVLSWRCASPQRPPEVRSSCLALRLLGSILFAFLFLHIRSVHPELIFFTANHLVLFCYDCVVCGAYNCLRMANRRQFPRCEPLGQLALPN
uniref:Transmembrane protein 44 n=1 Tax=Globodera pallida TaxID=36090 RepID=A0A183BVU9_GLOPA